MKPHLLDMDGVSVSVEGAEANPFLAAFVKQYSGITQQVYLPNSASARSPDLSLKSDPHGLQLSWNREGEKPLQFHIDVDKVIKQQRSYPAPKQGAFNQALGKRTKHIIDATGGWGGDAIVMCTQGYRVTVIERQPIMALMLSDAMTRMSRNPWVNDNGVVVPNVVTGNAIELLKMPDPDIDCVYLDPMFPAKKKKSAAVNKRMQLLHWLLGQEDDAAELVASAISGGYPRIAVKRPDYAAPLHCQPSTQFTSKLVHYDVYLAA